MNKLRKARRDQLILCALVSCVLGLLIWYGLIVDPLRDFKARSRKIAEAQQAADTAKRLKGLAGKLKADIGIAQQKLHRMEAKMAVGDPYRWLIKTFIDSPASTNVIISNLTPPQIGEMTICPKVPYKAANFSMSGTAYYRDLGSFLAKLENTFPHMRVKGLELEPASFGETAAEEDEKLHFQLEVMTLVNTSPPQTNGLSRAAPASSKD